MDLDGHLEKDDEYCTIARVSQRIPSMVSTERAQNICSIFFFGLMPHDPNLLNL